VLGLETGENVRDLGGYTTIDGRTTQWGRFVRSGDMDRLSVTDQARLVEHGIHTVIDLRMKWEIEQKPNVFNDSRQVKFRIHDFWGDRFDDYRSPDRSASPEKKLADLYCSGLAKSGFIMADVMNTFADAAEPGFAFHCRSGKDRTGLVSALLLAIAGVADETICADFALTSTLLRSEAVNPIDARAPGAWQRGCAPETMALTLAWINENYSGVTGYLSSIGVGQHQFRNIRSQLLDG